MLLLIANRSPNVRFHLRESILPLSSTDRHRFAHWLPVVLLCSSLPSCQRKSPQIDSQKTTPLATLVSDRLLKTLGLQPTRSSLGRLWD